jgi:integrase
MALNDRQLTDLFLKSLKPDQAGTRVNDGRGMFGVVRSLNSGAVSVDFQWRYSFAGKVRQIRLGAWPKLSLKAIRDQRAIYAGMVQAGTDPLGDREAKQIERETIRLARQTEALKKQADEMMRQHDQSIRLQDGAAMAARLTVRALFDQWQGADLRSRKDGGKAVLRGFEKDVFPLIGNMAAEDVSRGHIQRIVDTIKARNSNIQARHVFGDLRQLFGFALMRDHVSRNPTEGLKKAKIANKGQGERDRVLSESELIELFKKLPDSGLQQTSICAILIQISTLTRIGEILAASWCDIDFARRRWTLPDTKNGRKHTVHLNDLALQQFQTLRQLTGLSVWVFPNLQLTGPVDSRAVSKQVCDRQRGDAGAFPGRSKQTDSLRLQGGNWRPHDLRRTGATMLAELGAMPEVIERCLNHTEPSKIRKIYQRAQYEGPMRDAWNLLGERLKLLMNPQENIVLFNRAA